jgi:hypothetical protein
MTGTAAADTYVDPIVNRLVGYQHGLAGRDLNGVSYNGDVLDGRLVTGVSLVHVRLQGHELQSVRLEETRFVGVKNDGKAVQYNKFAGAEFVATLDDGSTLFLDIDAVEKGHGVGGKYTVYYEVSYETADSFEPLCGLDDDGLPILAIPLEGRWDLSEGTFSGGSKIEDPSSFTFACGGYALAKCAEAGYRPWETVKVCAPGRGCRHVSLAPYHQACTRMIRADFCGDGTSYTENGTEISYFDGLGIRYDSESWNLEAEWDEDGALCAVRDRIAGMNPSCMGELEDDDCGDVGHFAGGTLLITEVP